MYSEVYFHLADLHSDNGIIGFNTQGWLVMAFRAIQRRTHSVRIPTGCEALGSVVDAVSVLMRLGLCVWVLAGFADALRFRFRPDGFEELD